MKRDKALKKAEGLVSTERAEVYGDAKLNHQRIATMWSVIFWNKSYSAYGIFSYGRLLRCLDL